MAALKKPQLDELALLLKTQYQALLREVHDALENVGSLHRIDLLNHEPGDSGDESMANELADINVATLDHHIRDIRDIEAAFKRIKEGTFGACIDCGDDIAIERLQAFPTAKRCIVCQEKREREFVQEGHPTL